MDMIDAQTKVPDICIHPDFWSDHAALFAALVEQVEWDRRMRARLTASYGIPYDYSQIRYPERPMLPALAPVCADVAVRAGFEPNSCLLNYYADGRSTMGFHADSQADLAPGTGVAIVSLGATRTLRFRLALERTARIDFHLAPGSLVVVPAHVQDSWQHAIPPEPEAGPRISASFRCVML